MVQVVTPAADRSVDPNVVIPPVVQANAAVANALQEKFIREQAEARGEPPPAANDDAPAEITPVQPPPPPKAAPVKTAEDTWKARHDALQGRFVKQGDQLKSLVEQVGSMQRMMDQMAMQPRQPPPEPDTRATRLLTDDEVNDFGTEFLDVVGRRAEEVFAPRAQAYEREISQLKQQVAGVGGYVARNARDEMMGVLDADVPGWRDVNMSDGFKAWLALPDPYTGGIRHEMLKAAWDRNATSQAKAFFKGFLAEEAALAPARAAPAPAPARANGAPPKPSLEDFAAPGRAKSAAASETPAEKPTYTRQQITRFYTDVAAGRWRGREDERKQLDHSISLAVVEGRIV